ncbi:YciI family protein [Allorhizocola rhizosphaerae]|uniref:YciI family protein n=1 Tax=Allorhizocola rhizosphaerae TaxID=1872709 RepID=UPI000E3E5F94|nr:YciI family protein [Allorhizocola rhizosphaerae]
MRYLIMIYSNPKSREIWEGFTDEQRAEGWAAHRSLMADMAAAEELVLVQGLADPSRGKVVTTEDDGSAVVTDGPFAEAKEYLAGFFVVECEADRAIEYAARIPEAGHGLVEVRPIVSAG